MPIYYPPLQPGETYYPQGLLQNLPQLAQTIAQAMLVRGQRKEDMAQRAAEFGLKLSQMDPQAAAQVVGANEPQFRKTFGDAAVNSWKAQIKPSIVPTTAEETSLVSPPMKEGAKVFRPLTPMEQLKQTEAEAALAHTQAATETTKAQGEALRTNAAMDRAKFIAMVTTEYSNPDGTPIRREEVAQMFAHPELLAGKQVVSPERRKVLDQMSTLAQFYGPDEAKSMMADSLKLPIENLRLEHEYRMGQLQEQALAKQFAELKLMLAQGGGGRSPEDASKIDNIVNGIGKVLNGAEDGLVGIKYGTEEPGLVHRLYNLVGGAVSPSIAASAAGEAAAREAGTPDPVQRLRFGTATEQAVNADMKKAGIAGLPKVTVTMRVVDPATKQVSYIDQPLDIKTFKARILRARENTASLTPLMVNLASIAPDIAASFASSNPGLIEAIRAADPKAAAQLDALLKMNVAPAPSSPEDQRSALRKSNPAIAAWLDGIEKAGVALPGAR